MRSATQLSPTEVTAAIRLRGDRLRPYADLRALLPRLNRGGTTNPQESRPPARSDTGGGNPGRGEAANGWGGGRAAPPAGAAARRTPRGPEGASRGLTTAGPLSEARLRFHRGTGDGGGGGG